MQSTGWRFLKSVSNRVTGSIASLQNGRKSFPLPSCQHLHTSSCRKQGLNDNQSADEDVPLYDALNIQIKGYDFAVLEKFAKHVHHTAERVGLEVEDCWGTPGQKFKVTQLKSESNSPETEYILTMYERNVQIVEVPSTLLPLFVNIMETSIPAGVTVRIHPHLQDHTEIRYVPDLQLKELKSQLQEIRGDKENKK